MKVKIISIVCLTALTFGAIAAPVCVRSGITILVLSKDDTSGVVVNDTNSERWNVRVGYETYPGSNKIYGNVMCSNSFGTYGVANARLDEMVIETGGENCWCRMTFPMSSYWIFVSEGNCNTASCANACATAYAKDVTFRSNMIDSIW